MRAVVYEAAAPPQLSRTSRKTGTGSCWNRHTNKCCQRTIRTWQNLQHGFEALGPWRALVVLAVCWCCAMSSRVDILRTGASRIKRVAQVFTAAHAPSARCCERASEGEPSANAPRPQGLLSAMPRADVIMIARGEKEISGRTWREREEEMGR